MRSIKTLALTAAIAAAVLGTPVTGGADMNHRTLAEYGATVPMPVDVNAVAVHARPRALDPRYYDIDLTVAGKPVPTVSIFTGTLVNRPTVHEEIVRTADALADVALSVRYAYDAGSLVCPVEFGDTCPVWAPFDPTKPPTTLPRVIWSMPPTIRWDGLGFQSEAAIIIEAVVNANGSETANETLKIPFAGQAGSLAG